MNETTIRASEPRIRPVMILPKGQVSKRDIKKLFDNGICVIEATDPAAVRFADPPPQGYSVQERAAIALCRTLMLRRNGIFAGKDIAEMLADFLIEGSPLAVVTPIPKPSK